MEFGTFISSALQECSRIALHHFGKVVGITKPGDNNQVLTDADIAIGKAVLSRIKEAYPDHNIIDEEAGIIDNCSDFTWVIDPIDGTSNFAEGVPLYGIIIGLLERDVPIAGGIALPAFSEICIAERGNGAWCNNERIGVNKRQQLLSSLVAYGIDGHQENPSFTREECALLGELTLHIRNLRMSGCVFDGMMVAKGAYGAYLNRTCRIWDIVGLHCIIEEAGGIFTDFFGTPIDYTNPLRKADDTFTFCAAGPTLHDEIQKIIHGTTQGW
jgi:myo-inositol-1(or 4)-monophosphatase